MLYSSEIPETNKRENYVLIKEVEAEPMTLGDFYNKQGYSIPPTANVYNIKGYAVYYQGKMEWCSTENFKSYAHKA